MATLPTIKTYKQESAKKVYEAIEYSKTAFDKEEDIIYVLDTNALLKVFALDKTSFAQLKSVFEQRRFYATHQIETEFLRNRENVSKQYYFYNRKRFVEKYKDLNSSIQQFINDFTFVIAGNEILKSKLLSLKEIANDVSDSTEDFNNHLSEEEADVDIMNYFKMIVDNIDFSTTLEDKEYDNLKKEFEELFKKSKDKNNKESLPDFPGRGEKKQINEYGDYLIFHELLKLSKDKKKSVILLTNDVTKDDWVDKDGNTFESYQIMFYSVTGHSFKVEKYDDFLKEKVKINPEVIVSDFPDYIWDERNGRLIPKYQFGAINGEYMEYQRFNDSERLIHDLLFKLYRELVSFHNYQNNLKENPPKYLVIEDMNLLFNNVVGMISNSCYLMIKDMISTYRGIINLGQKCRISGQIPEMYRKAIDECIGAMVAIRMM